MSTQPNTTDLDRLEALATGYQQENNDHWYNEHQLADGITYEPATAFILAANPAAILELIALARRSLPVDGDEREAFMLLCEALGIQATASAHLEAARLVAEIADLRAALAAKGDAQAPAGDYIGTLRSTLYAIANTLDDHELRQHARAAYALPVPAATQQAAREQQEPVAEVDAGEDGLFVEILYGEDGSPLKVGDKLYLAAPVAQQSEALDADEMTRLRRLIHALGMDGSTNASDEQVRGLLFTALGQAASKIEHQSEAGAPTAAASRPELTVWYGSMPESNGKSNFTAILRRKDAGPFDTCHITIDRSEYPDRVRYEADRVRWIIGELAEEPFILDYDADKHSGYKKPEAGRESAAPGAKQDAKRYQWMRHTFIADDEFWPDAVADAKTGDDLDAAIDAAMQKGAQDNG